jgi:hypothetical protein
MRRFVLPLAALLLLLAPALALDASGDWGEANEELSGPQTLTSQARHRCRRRRRSSSGPALCARSQPGSPPPLHTPPPP